MQARAFYSKHPSIHSTRLALDAPPLNCRPPSPVFSPRHAFASTHTAALHIRAPHAPRSLQSSHVPRCSAPDVLVFAHDRPRSSRRATNPHVLDPTRPRAPPCGQSCRLTRPPTLLARTPRRHSSLQGAAPTRQIMGSAVYALCSAATRPECVGARTLSLR